MKVLLLILIIVINFLPHDYIDFKIVLLSIAMLSWIVYVLIVLCRLQKEKSSKNKRENDLYIKDIPKTRTVFELYYLLNKQIDAPVLGISLMELIRKKALLLRYNPKNDDYIFIYNSNIGEKLTHAENFLLDWILTKIGNGERVSFSLIKKDACTNSAYFLSCYEDWRMLASLEGTKPPFFEITNHIVDQMVAYISLSIFLALVSLFNSASPMITVPSLVSTLILIMYINSFYLRTKDGNNEYYKWISFADSIKKGDACNNTSSLISLERVAIYSKILGVKANNMWTSISMGNICDITDSEFIKYAMIGIIDEIQMRMKKLVSAAMMISFVFPRNKGSRANVKYKRKERE